MKGVLDFLDMDVKEFQETESVRRRGVGTDFVLGLVLPEHLELLCAQLGIDPPVEGDRIEYIDLWRLMVAHLSLVDDEAHLSANQTTPRGVFNVLLSAASVEATLKEAFKKLETAALISQSSYRMDYSETSNVFGVTVTLQHASEPKSSLVASVGAMVLICYVSMLTNRKCLPSRVDVSGCAPEGVVDLLQVSRAPVFRGGEGVTLWYARDLSLGDARNNLQSFDASLFIEFERMVERFLDQTIDYRDNCVWQVQDCIRRGFFDFPEIAQELNLSVATLRRRLGASRTNFRTLLDQFRRYRFYELSKEGIRLAQIATRLGYEDDRSLRRARKRWSSEPGAVD